MDERVPFSEIVDAFGAAATVTRPHPDNTPISTSIVWEPIRENIEPGGMGFGRQDGVRVMGIARADVASVPIDTLIEVPEIDGGTVKRWRVVGRDRDHDDHVSVQVVLAPRSRVDA